MELADSRTRHIAEVGIRQDQIGMMCNIAAIQPFLVKQAFVLRCVYQPKCDADTRDLLLEFQDWDLATQMNVLTGAKSCMPHLPTKPYAIG